MPALREQIEVCEFIPVRVIPTPEDQFIPTRKITSVVFPNNQVAEDVVNYAEIEDEVESIKAFITRMNKHGFLGIAGEAISQPQVNSHSPKRYFVDKDLNVYYNPVITEQTTPICAEECCLSYPTKPTIETERYFSVTVSYYDETDTLQEDVVLTSTAAVMFQHAIDHLNGIYIYN